MKIGFISDTHGGYEDTMKALQLLVGCETVCHLGDVLYHGPRNDIPATYEPKKLAALLKERKDIIYVRGNCDADVDATVTGQDLSEKSRVVSFDHYRFYLVHGYEESEEERIKRAKELDCQIVVTGHTHVKVLEEKDGIILLNPGSTTIPKDGSASCALYENGELKLIDLESGTVLKKLALPAV